MVDNNGDDVWRADAVETTLLVRVNGQEEKVRKSTIVDLQAFVGETATKHGVDKFRLKIDGEKVKPHDISDYSVSDVSLIEIDTYDQARTF